MRSIPKKDIPLSVQYVTHITSVMLAEDIPKEAKFGIYSCSYVALLTFLRCNNEVH